MIARIRSSLRAYWAFNVDAYRASISQPWREQLRDGARSFGFLVAAFLPLAAIEMSGGRQGTLGASLAHAWFFIVLVGIVHDATRTTRRLVARYRSLRAST